MVSERISGIELDTLNCPYSSRNHRMTQKIIVQSHLLYSPCREELGIALAWTLVMQCFGEDRDSAAEEHTTEVNNGTDTQTS